MTGTREAVIKPFGDRLLIDLVLHVWANAATLSPQWRFSIWQTLGICQSHHSNSHSGGVVVGWGGWGGADTCVWFSALRWRSVNTNQRPDLPTVIYQTSSSIRVKSCVLPVSSLGGLEKSYDRKVKVKERPKWRRVAPTIFLQSCWDPILFSSISCKRFQSYLTFLPCNQIAVAIQMQFWKSR